MKEKLKRALSTMQRFNSADMCREVFGLERDVLYDALVVAPGWKPTKIIKDPSYKVTVLAEHSYVSGYLVEIKGLRIAWIQCASGAPNLLDHLMLCAELSFRRLIFVGAVGSLVKDIPIGTLCTPSSCVSGVYADAYLCDRLTDWRPFAEVKPKADDLTQLIGCADACGYPLRAARVFCTDSIAMEYSHLEEILAHGAELIEMETSTFYRLAALFEVPAIALLVVSDNSAVGDPLIGRSEEQDRAYHTARSVMIPRLVTELAALP